MSGGHFQYKQWEIGNIADEVEQLILTNDSEEKNEWGDRKGYHYTPETIEEFKKGLVLGKDRDLRFLRTNTFFGTKPPDISFFRTKTSFSQLKSRLRNSNFVWTQTPCDGAGPFYNLQSV